MHVEFSRELGGGFSLRKKPLSSMASVDNNSENALQKSPLARQKKWEISSSSKLNQRSRQTRAGMIEKKPHAQRFGALHGHQPHLPADMVAIHQSIRLRLVKLRVLLQPRNTLFEGAAKTRTDLKAIAGCTLSHHGRLLKIIFSLSKKILSVVKVSLDFADLNKEFF
jgi:hypothetical protein